MNKIVISPYPVVLIAGLRHAGRSLVLQRLELSGYTCVDNLPPVLVPGYLAHVGAGEDSGRIAVALETDGSADVRALEDLLDRLDDEEYPYRLVFMEAGDTALHGRMEAASDSLINAEDVDFRPKRKELAPVRTRAHLVLDSSYASVLEERDRIISLCEGLVHRPGTVVDIMSFGFKYGTPAGDLVLDVRFIPNPYYVAALRPLNGKNKACAEYVLGQESARRTLDALVLMVETMLPAYSSQSRASLTVRIGCTGGQHRSVALAEALGAAFRDKGKPVQIRHREMDAGRYVVVQSPE